MTEPTLTIVATIIGVVYVLTYAWGRLEILAYLTGLWKECGRLRMIGLGLRWAAMNCFAFLSEDDVHYNMIRQRRLVLYDLDAWWAKAAAVLIVVIYWAWVAASLKFAIVRWHDAKKSQQ